MEMLNWKSRPQEVTSKILDIKCLEEVISEEVVVKLDTKTMDFKTTDPNIKWIIYFQPILLQIYKISKMTLLC